MIERLDPFYRVYPVHTEDVLILEHAGTFREYRRMGLISKLFKAMIERGRDKGYERVDLGYSQGISRPSGLTRDWGSRLRRRVPIPNSRRYSAVLE